MEIHGRYADDDGDDDDDDDDDWPSSTFYKSALAFNSSADKVCEMLCDHVLKLFVDKQYQCYKCSTLYHLPIINIHSIHLLEIIEQ